MNENITKKEATFTGIFFASLFITIIILFIIIIILGFVIWSPASYYLGKWNNYWYKKNYRTIDISSSKNDSWNRTKNAYEVCSDDCYAIKYEKII